MLCPVGYAEHPCVGAWSKNHWSHWGFLTFFCYYLSQAIQQVTFVQLASGKFLKYSFFYSPLLCLFGTLPNPLISVKELASTTFWGIGRSFGLFVLLLKQMTQWKNNIGTWKGRRGGGEGGVSGRGQREVSLGRLLGFCGMGQGTVPACSLLQACFSLSLPSWLRVVSVLSIFQSFVVNNQFKPGPSLSFCNSENPLNYIVGGKQ